MIRKVDTGFRKTSCSTKRLEPGDDSKRSQSALVERDKRADCFVVASERSRRRQRQHHQLDLIVPNLSPLPPFLIL
jgi:hypothetical protein